MLRLGSIPLPPEGLEEDGTLRMYPYYFIEFGEDHDWSKLSCLATHARMDWPPNREVSFTKYLVERLCKTVERKKFLTKRVF